ncbi:hypothetical protein BJX62DRAFT_159480 [Aspergillus germanicus]
MPTQRTSVPRKRNFPTWIHLKFTGMVEVYQRTEWHRLEVILDEDEDEDDSDEEMDEDHDEEDEDENRNDKEQLRLNLCRMLQLFPQWNRWYEDGTSDDPTSEFEASTVRALKREWVNRNEDA